jgi:ubiquitin C-terminal hydrolase
MNKSITTSTNPKAIYDLYAVSNHYGSLGGGHYTAMCKNPVFDIWAEFDDSSVSKISNRDVCFIGGDNEHK